MLLNEDCKCSRILQLARSMHSQEAMIFNNIEHQATPACVGALLDIKHK